MKYAFQRMSLLTAALFLTASCAAPPVDQDDGPFDVVISGGKVVDGTGAGWFYGDVGIRGERIAAVLPAGGLDDQEAGARIDASGLVVAPGFIDIQSHSRGDFLSGDGRVISKVTQGITTEIMGEGWTNAPSNHHTAQGDGLVNPEVGGERLDFSGPEGFSRWLEAMEANGVSPNIGSFVGATTLRVFGMGEAGGPANPAQLDSMKMAARWAMEGGAFGVATALIYPPGNYASTEELTEVVSATAPYGGLYITHMRSEADRFLEAIDESIAIATGAGVPLEIYHLKAAGVRNHYKAPLAIAKIDSARAEGIDVQANMYPYTAGGTGLSAVLPPWASENGALMENIVDPETRARIHAEVINDTGDWENLGVLATPEGLMILGDGDFDGKRLSEIAAERGKDWVETAMDLLTETEGRVGMIIFMMTEPNLELQMQQPWMKFGTDAGGFNPETASGSAHPRAYGTFPRILGRYVRERGVMPLEDAVRKMTSAVTTRLSIPDRGVLKEGFYADVVVFDETTIIDNSTYEDPHNLSTGMVHVLVNGQAVIQDGAHTGAKPGKIVRGPGYRGS